MIVIVYVSATGNTEALAGMIKQEAEASGEEVCLMPAPRLDTALLKKASVLFAGTYSWGQGEMPDAALEMAEELSTCGMSPQAAGCFGTGDTFYPHFCGGVDELKASLPPSFPDGPVLKVELLPQPSDRKKCRRFVEQVLNQKECMASGENG
ncbi:flavodoxin domain-containing protein [Alkalicoccus urumqiensis]|uniref:Flavodoxin-like domain-containing protein n=1 Tax=Alkalicoccus urumqiensis TaxID=1548213 RepID=A0A2P6MGN8_ALKUR|nr:flavodoxin domain-containing protein [Alkalicoccus urumqiensis]PRO65458.1 hypothetical protein C6I21_09895 [Alkalicoccus urumqiensis]